MTYLAHEIEQLEKLACGVETFEKLSNMARGFALSGAGNLFPELHDKYLVKARLRQKAAARLRQRIVKLARQIAAKTQSV